MTRSRALENRRHQPRQSLPRAPIVALSLPMAVRHFCARRRTQERLVDRRSAERGRPDSGCTARATWHAGGRPDPYGRGAGARVGLKGAADDAPRDAGIQWDPKIAAAALAWCQSHREALFLPGKTLVPESLSA